MPHGSHSHVLNWETCLFYLDDISVFSKTWEEHVECLKGVFQCLREAKLKMGATKCTLTAPEVSYLRQCMTRDGLLPNPALLKATREIPTPQHVKEVWSFLRLAFLKLKHLLTMAPITAFPDFNVPFRLYTDASTLGLGAILAQVQDGKERIICCSSRVL